MFATVFQGQNESAHPSHLFTVYMCYDKFAAITVIQRKNEKCNSIANLQLGIYMRQCTLSGLFYM